MFAKFEILTAVASGIRVFCDVKLCFWVCRPRLIEGPYYVGLWGWSPPLRRH